MSYEEKRMWIYAGVVTVTYAAYLVVMLGRAQYTPLAEASYAGPMLLAIGGAVVASVLLTIVVGIVSPSEAGKADERDRDIHRFGEYAGGAVLGFGMLLPFGLALAEVPHFWIANAMYLVFVVSALVGTTLKLFAYRRGF
jgi:hypothetical protein